MPTLRDQIRTLIAQGKFVEPLTQSEVAQALSRPNDKPLSSALNFFARTETLIRRGHRGTYTYTAPVAMDDPNQLIADIVAAKRAIERAKGELLRLYRLEKHILEAAQR